MKLDLRFLSSLSLVAALGFGTGCPADEDPQDTTDTEAGSSGSTDPTDATATTTDPTATTTDPTATTTDPTATTTDPTVGETDGTSTTDPTSTDPLPNGESCTTDGQCESGHCFVAGALGGLCGECTGDADCEGGGCSLPNPLANPPTGSVCNTGELGDGCETSDVCMGDLTCVEIINVPGILVANTCSECTTSDECTDQVCNVAIDVANITGEKTCVDASSVADGEFCDLEGDGEDACMNHCAEADIMSLLTFGVCGACRDDADCTGGMTCTAPEVGLDGAVTPSVCM